MKLNEKSRTIVMKFSIVAADKHCLSCEYHASFGPIGGPDMAHTHMCCKFGTMLKYDKKMKSCVRHKDCIKGEQ